jgi:hypothetical protein
MCSDGNSTFGATTSFYLPLTRPSGNNTFGAIRGEKSGEILLVLTHSDGDRSVSPLKKSYQ